MGLADELGITEADVDPKQLAMGIDIEFEHTDDAELAKQIALDHLAEIPDYYSRLKKMEDEAEAPKGDYMDANQNPYSENVSVAEYLSGKSPLFRITEARKYIKDPSQAPPGAKVKRGDKGGYYYDTDGGSVSKPSDPLEDIDSLADDEKQALADKAQKVLQSPNASDASKKKAMDILDRIGDYEGVEVTTGDQIFDFLMKGAQVTDKAIGQFIGFLVDKGLISPDDAEDTAKFLNDTADKVSGGETASEKELRQIIDQFLAKKEEACKGDKVKETKLADDKLDLEIKKADDGEYHWFDKNGADYGVGHPSTGQPASQAMDNMEKDAELSGGKAENLSVSEYLSGKSPLFGEAKGRKKEQSVEIELSAPAEPPRKYSSIYIDEKENGWAVECNKKGYAWGEPEGRAEYIVGSLEEAIAVIQKTFAETPVEQ